MAFAAGLRLVYNFCESQDKSDNDDLSHYRAWLIVSANYSSQLRLFCGCSIIVTQLNLIRV